MKKYLNVMRAFRVPRVFTEHEAKAEGDKENENDLHSDPTRACECEMARIGEEINNDHIIPNECSVTSNSEVDQSCSRTQSCDMWMTSSGHSPKRFVPDCFPKFGCRRFGEETKHRSWAYKALALLRAKVLTVVEHKYFDAFILFVILISSMSLVSSKGMEVPEG